MKTIRIVLFNAAMALLFVSLSANAQTGSINFYLGAGPGTLKESISVKTVTTESNGSKQENKRGYDFNYSNISYFANLEYQYSAFSFFAEAVYTQPKFKDFSDYTNERFLKLDPNTFSNNSSVISAAIFAGPTLFAQKRFQLPLLVGFGADYVIADNNNALHIGIHYKVRAKFYLTSKLGIFAGYSGGFSFATLDPKLNLATEDPSDNAERILRHNRIEFGLTYMIGLK